MKQIEVAIMNPEAIRTAEQMACGSARLTQRAEKISCMDDLLELFAADRVNENFLTNLCKMPHPTLQKFATINVAVVGASRRFLAQITRHQNEVKFMSGSLQYSNYGCEGNKTDFVIPYNYIGTSLEAKYISDCQWQFDAYRDLVKMGEENGFTDAADEAGYAMVQGLRNVLIISATPYQWKHMIGQRICSRNTLETRYVMLKIWEALYDMSPMFKTLTWGCMGGDCKEGSRMICTANGGKPIGKLSPKEILKRDFPKLYTE